MMYNEKLVVAVKSDGKILREYGEDVFIKFGSDYSLLIKNLNTEYKALVKVTIDGKDVLDGNKLIIDPNSSTNLKGFLSGNKVRNKFKFIEKTKDIENYRGNKLEDGLIRVTYRFEKSFMCNNFVYTNNIQNDFPNFYNTNISSANMLLSSNVDCSVRSENNVGITTNGDNNVNQVFNTGNIGCLDLIEHVIILRLLGKTESNKYIRNTVKIKTKLKCNVCGKKSSSSAKYCRNCGTCLL